jgi:hypothetical protein
MGVPGGAHLLLVDLFGGVDLLVHEGEEIVLVALGAVGDREHGSGIVEVGVKFK